MLRLGVEVSLGEAQLHLGGSKSSKFKPRVHLGEDLRLGEHSFS